jgi:outer membrane protein TolC
MDISMRMSRQELSRDGGDAFLSLSPSGAWDRNISLSLRFPDIARFFDFQGGTKRQQLTERNQAETLRELQMQVEQEVRGRVVDLRLAQRSLEIQGGRGILAEERLSLSLESYRMGGATTFDQLKNALEQAEQARRQELQARHALERALIDLEETLGVPLASAGVRTSTGD